MKAYFIGGGIGSLAGATFLIRDGGMSGDGITIYEQLPTFGGSLDGARLSDGSYSLRGGRMLTTDHYECTWDLLSTIPSIEHAGRTVRDETVAFNLKHRAIPKHGSSIVIASRSTCPRWDLPCAIAKNWSAWRRFGGNSWQ